MKRALFGSALTLALLGTAHADWDSFHFARLGDNEILIVDGKSAFSLHKTDKWSVSPAQQSSLSDWLKLNGQADDVAHLVADLATKQKQQLPVGEITVDSTHPTLANLKLRVTLPSKPGLDKWEDIPSGKEALSQFAKRLGTSKSTLLVKLSQAGGDVSEKDALDAIVKAASKDATLFDVIEKDKKPVAIAYVVPVKPALVSSAPPKPAVSPTVDEKPKGDVKVPSTTDSSPIAAFIGVGLFTFVLGGLATRFAVASIRKQKGPSPFGQWLTGAPDEVDSSSGSIAMKGLMERPQLVDFMKRIASDIQADAQRQKVDITKLIDQRANDIVKRYSLFAEAELHNQTLVKQIEGLKGDVANLESYRRFQAEFDKFQYAYTTLEEQAKKAQSEYAAASEQRNDLQSKLKQADITIEKLEKLLEECAQDFERVVQFSQGIEASLKGVSEVTSSL